MRLIKYILFSLLFCVGISAAPTGGGFDSTASQTQQTRKPWFWGGVKVGNMDSSHVEISGMTQGRRAENKGYLWAIEDGANPHLIAVNASTAASAGVWTPTGITVVDVEDVDGAIVGGQPYIYLFDTGDNGNVHSTFTVVRYKEPVITGSDGSFAAGDRIQITCEFPAGNMPSHKDLEAAFADPSNGDLYFITKRITPVLLYKLAHAATYTGTQTLTYLGQLTNDAAFNTISTTPTGNNGYVTGACISPNGTEILVCSYLNNWRFSRNKNTQTILQALQQTPTALESVVGSGNGAEATQQNSLPQQESICFDPSGINFYTCSELVANSGGSASHYPLYKFRRAEKQPTTYSFQEGVSSYSGTTDTYLDSTNPTTDNGAGISMVADYDYSAYPTVSRTRQGLLRFDVSSIPSTDTVISAYVDVYINTEGLGFSFHKCLVTWSEASTWNSLTGGMAIDNTDASTTADAYIGPVTVGQSMDGYVGLMRVNIPVATVQGWVTNSATNFGWTIMGPVESSGDGLQLDSSEGATSSRRPKLVIRTISN